nr:retrovirus-related Pol polyprotein from transposon TNT 1-94 [Tanacetum cinerariifolium]
MANLLEDIQCAGFDTRPPMLDRIDFDSWQQRIRLYCWGKENEVNILKSIDEGPFQMETVREPIAEGTKREPHLGPERPRVYSNLSPEERDRDEIASVTDGPYLGPEQDIVVADLSQAKKDRLRANIRATNILLQGFPRDIYKLINHSTDAKGIWDNVKMLLEGSELTKDDRESQLYDEFKHFGQHKGENIHDYYIRFTKLIDVVILPC